MASGDRFARDGRTDAALIEYRNAVKSWPASTEAHERLGDALAEVGRIDEAYRAYSAGARIVDGQMLAHDEERLREVIERQPALVAARVALAEVLLSREAIAEAEEQLRAATDAEPDNELANRSLAALYLETGRRDEAEARLAVAAAQEPQRYRSRLALADFLMEGRRYADARPVLEKARQDPKLAGAAALRLAAVGYEEGAVEEARRTLSALIEESPSAEAWALRARFLYREGDLGGALDATREALSLNPDLAAAQHLADTIRRQQLWPR